MYLFPPARRSCLLASAAVFLALLAGAGRAEATIRTSATGEDIAFSMRVADQGLVTTARFLTRPPAGTPTGVSDGAIGSFPTDGSDFGILTTGDAALADDPNVSGGEGADDSGAGVRGGSELDVTILQIGLYVPADRPCVRFDFQFLSQEFPTYVGQGFNDSFIAEMDNTTWTASGSAISAPDNFAFDDHRLPISVDTSGPLAMSHNDALGTTYDGATKVLRASKEVSPGEHQLFLSVFEQRDRIYDSAAFVDKLVADDGPCETGVVTTENRPPDVGEITGSGSADEGDSLNYSLAAADPDGDSLDYEWSVLSGNATIDGPADEPDVAVRFTDGPSTVELGVAVSDGVGPTVTRTLAIDERNVAPTLTPLTVKNGTGIACRNGSDVGLEFGFTDPAGANDAYNGAVSWGDGQVTQFTSSPVSVLHAYPAGRYTIDVEVTDDDGGSDERKSAPDAVTLRYGVSGILPPVNADGSSVFKNGSTVPVKVRVTDCTGAPVTDLAPSIGTSVQSASTPADTINETPSTSAADTTGVMRYDPAGAQYIYNLATKYLPDANASYVLHVRDPSFGQVTQRFGLRSK